MISIFVLAFCIGALIPLVPMAIIDRKAKRKESLRPMQRPHRESYNSETYRRL